jgi:hypothetical protein
MRWLFLFMRKLESLSQDEFVAMFIIGNIVIALLILVFMV